MKKLALFLLSAAAALANYPNQQSVLLDAGQTTVTLHDLGAGGAPDLIVSTKPGTTRTRVTVVPIMATPSAFIGSTYSTCAAPCVLNIYRDWGDWYVFQEPVDGSGNPLSPRQYFGPQAIPFSGIVSAPGAWTLPLEVIGQDNFQRAVQFTLGGGVYNNRRLRFWVSNHNYNQPGAGLPGSTSNLYDGKMSVQINFGSWINLNCSNVTQLDENKWFGVNAGCSIGAPTFTIMLSAAIPDGLVGQGTNTVRFRLNGTEGNTSGFRILDFNIEDTTTVTQLDSISVTSNVANMVAHAATSWATNDSWFVYQAPGIQARFNGVRQLTKIDSTHATFVPCGQTVNTILAAACTSPDTGATPKTVPISLLPSVQMATQPVMYAVKEDIAAGTFAWDDPTTWTAPAGGNAATGATLWATRNILVNPKLPYLNHTITVSCADCHTKGLSDLKKFNYSNHSIEERTHFHGGSYQNGLDIAAAVRAVTVVTAGAVCRPWNPPYQPGLGLDAGALAEWTCGVGIGGQLTYGEDVYEYLSAYDWSAAAAAGSNYVNMRELPSPWQFPDWNHWLAPIHPQDYFAGVSPAFFSSDPYTGYTSMLANVTPGSCSSYVSWRTAGGSPQTPLEQFFFNNGWSAYLTAVQAAVPKNSVTEGYPAFKKPSLYPIAVLSITSVAVTKLWEVHQELGIENCGSQVMTQSHGARPSGNYISRMWASPMMFDHGDHKASAQGTLEGGLDNSPTSHYYLSNIWYVGLQAVLNMGNFDDGPDDPMDSPYTIGVGLLEITSYTTGGPPGGQHGRPAGFWALIMSIAGVQAGYDNLIFGPGTTFDVTNLLSMRFLFSPSGGPLAYATSFMTAAQLTAHYTAIANQFVPSVNAFGNTAAWQTYLAGDTCEAHGELAAYGGGGSSCDNIAFGIPNLVYFGVPSATIDGIQAWAQAVWPSHNFALDRAASCTNTVNGAGDASWPVCANIFF